MRSFTSSKCLRNMKISRFEAHDKWVLVVHEKKFLHIFKTFWSALVVFCRIQFDGGLYIIGGNTVEPLPIITFTQFFKAFFQYKCTNKVKCCKPSLIYGEISAFHRELLKDCRFPPWFHKKLTVVIFFLMTFAYLELEIDFNCDTNYGKQIIFRVNTFTIPAHSSLNRRKKHPKIFYFLWRRQTNVYTPTDIKGEFKT